MRLILLLFGSVLIAFGASREYGVITPKGEIKIVLNDPVRIGSGETLDGYLESHVPFPLTSLRISLRTENGTGKFTAPCGSQPCYLEAAGPIRPWHRFSIGEVVGTYFHVGKKESTSGLRMRFTFEDANVLLRYRVDAAQLTENGFSVSSTIGVKQVEIAALNDSDVPVEIDWNRSSFVWSDGTSSRILNGATKFIDTGIVQPVTIIPPRSRQSFEAMPEACIRGREVVPIALQTLPIEADMDTANALVGKSFRLYLAISIGGRQLGADLEMKVMGIVQ